ncbi:MAG: radical SAM protein [Deltaproteobacteria bacterium]|nr:radical SAM protein [Deltaproteobacteria bacterium]
MDRAAEIFDGMIARRFNLSWEAPNGLGVNFLSPPLLEKMAASGCETFTIAVEAATDATLRRVKKPNYIRLAPPIVEKAKSLGMEVRGFFMIGFPGETLEEVQRTIDYARNLQLTNVSFAIVTPLPGTPLFAEVVDAGLLNLDQVDFEDFSFGAFDIQLAQVPNDQLKVLRKIEWMRMVFFNPAGEFKHDVQMARKDVLERVTHGHRGDIVDMYTEVPWALLCEEVAKLRDQDDEEDESTISGLREVVHIGDRVAISLPAVRLAPNELLDGDTTRIELPDNAKSAELLRRRKAVKERSGSRTRKPDETSSSSGISTISLTSLTAPANAPVRWDRNAILLLLGVAVLAILAALSLGGI